MLTTEPEADIVSGMIQIVRIVKLTESQNRLARFVGLFVRVTNLLARTILKD